MAEEAFAGQSAAPALCAHVPGSVSYEANRQGYLIRCVSCQSPLGLIPNEWPVIESLNSCPTDERRFELLREIDAAQQRGELCICGRVPNPDPTIARHVDSRCGQCNPQAMRLVSEVARPPMTAGASAMQSAFQQYRSADLAKPFRQTHEIEDVRGRVESPYAFRCRCGWTVSRKFAEEVLLMHGEREMIRMLETHCAGGQVGPTPKPVKPAWITPLIAEREHRPFWKCPVFRQVWQTPTITEPAYTPRRRIVLEDA